MCVCVRERERERERERFLTVLAGNTSITIGNSGTVRPSTFAQKHTTLTGQQNASTLGVSKPLE